VATPNFRNFKPILTNFSIENFFSKKSRDKNRQQKTDKLEIMKCFFPSIFPQVFLYFTFTRFFWRSVFKSAIGFSSTCQPVHLLVVAV